MRSIKTFFKSRKHYRNFVDQQYNGMISGVQFSKTKLIFILNIVFVNKFNQIFIHLKKTWREKTAQIMVDSLL